MNILFLEDDPVIGDIVVDFLSESYRVEHCFNSADALKKAEASHYDLYLFDINVPGISGIDLLKELRAFNDSTPAIFITAYQDIEHLKQGFAAGANDFMRKPFELEELGIRIESLRRQFNIDEKILISEGVVFDPKMNQISVDGKPHTVSAKESEVLHYLIKNKTRVISSEELLQNLWEYEDMPLEDTIRTYVKTLRHIIGKEHIVNVRSKGYKFE